MDSQQACWSFRTEGIKASDVLPVLKEKVAFVSGGRDKRGGPILTFPARSNHDRIKQEDLGRLVTYLSTVPRAIHTQESNAPFFSITAAHAEQRLICISMKAAVFAADSSKSVTLNFKSIYS
ncbi:kalirin [Lates japonicus]|uniref:Kalirin n=1 Tax=Lates japonicus TaxID=270547 RepID=A0AAD3NJB7_LATJO|nr:kalirin [Lates japonicus]